jgi:hypothetical protein
MQRQFAFTWGVVNIVGRGKEGASRVFTVLLALRSLG